MRNPWSKATSSASGVEWATLVCFLDEADKPNLLPFGPTNARKTPDVEREVSLSPAKSASQKSSRRRSASLSQIEPT